MGRNSGIGWTDATFNPWIGCQKVSEACRNCYAAELTNRFGCDFFGVRRKTSESYWQQLFHWQDLAKRGHCISCAGKGWTKYKKDKSEECVKCYGTGRMERRQRVFVASLADVFESYSKPVVANDGFPIRKDAYGVYSSGSEADGSFVYLAELRELLFRIIDQCQSLDFLLLTKRPENVLRMWPRVGFPEAGVPGTLGRYLRYPNVWIGTTVEDQKQAYDRIPELLKCRSLTDVLFLSCEPLLGPIDLTTSFDLLRGKLLSGPINPAPNVYGKEPKIDWVIAGGESGRHARPMHPKWIRSLRDQCKTHSVPFFFKQWGEFIDADADEVTMADEMRISLPWHNAENNYDQTQVARLGTDVTGNMLDGVYIEEFPERS